MSIHLRLQAISDFLKNYHAAFKHAWAHRQTNAIVERLPHEAQFLPAALSLQETPVSAAPRVLIWILITFASLTLLWAFLGKIDIVATAQGKIVPNNRTKTIQPFETATVKAIYVTDGQRVKAGEVLIDLDATYAEADIHRLYRDVGLAKLQVARSNALLIALETGNAPQLIRPLDIEESIFQEATDLLAGQMSEYTAKLNRIEAGIATRKAELISTQALVRKFQQTTPIAKQKSEDMKKLVDKNYASQHDYLASEQALIEQEADLAHAKSRLKEIEATLHEAQSQLAELTTQTRRITLDSLTEGQQKAQTLEQELLKAHSRGKLMQLTSPVDGTVQQLAIHTIGGVVTPAQPVMLIVPQDPTVEVEAFIENKDIGFVNPNQKAEVKIETFQYTKYGTIQAHVTSVSHDAINDEKRGLIYSTRIKMNQSTIQVEGKSVNLSPGMAVSVEIKTGKRRIIDYFLSPLIQHTSESLRER